MELLWLVLSLIVVDLAAFLFAVDTRPGLQHTSRWRDRRHDSGADGGTGRDLHGSIGREG